MTSLSPTGIRIGNNTFLFPSYDGKSHDTPSQTTKPACYPRFSQFNRPHRSTSRPPSGSKYDVRATYPEAHTLHIKHTPPVLSVLPQASLNDSFLQATISEGDDALKELQANGGVVKTKEDKTKSWWTEHRENRWRVSKPADRTRSPTTMRRPAECPHICTTCEVLPRLAGSKLAPALITLLIFCYLPHAMAAETAPLDQHQNLEPTSWLSPFLWMLSTISFPFLWALSILFTSCTWALSILFTSCAWTLSILLTYKITATIAIFCLLRTHTWGEIGDLCLAPSTVLIKAAATLYDLATWFSTVLFHLTLFLVEYGLRIISYLITVAGYVLAWLAGAFCGIIVEIALVFFPVFLWVHDSIFTLLVVIGRPLGTWTFWIVGVVVFALVNMYGGWGVEPRVAPLVSRNISGEDRVVWISFF